MGNANRSTASRAYADAMMQQNKLGLTQRLAQLCLLTVALSSMTTGCTPDAQSRTQASAPTAATSSTERLTMQPEVTIKLGMKPAEFNAALGLDKTAVSKQPAGMNFYTRDFDQRGQPLGIVKVLHGPHSFQVNHVLSVMGSEEVRRSGTYGIEEVDINFDQTAAPTISHQLAREKWLAFLKHLQSLGWQQYYFLSEARIKGRSSLKALDIDVRYEPTFEEWMALGTRASWKLKADGVYMDISMQRDRTRMDPQREGAYFFSITLQTEELAMRLMVPDEQRDNWRALWPVTRQKKLLLRAKEEKEAQLAGQELDTAYQDQEPK